MNSTLEQQNFPTPLSDPQTFASDPEAQIAEPGNPYYADGVSVNYTAPVKWWNWLWNHISAWLAASKLDRSAVHTELSNFLDYNHMYPMGGTTNQLSYAIDLVDYRVCSNYDDTKAGGQHKVHQPYVVGHTLYLPDTELL